MYNGIETNCLDLTKSIVFKLNVLPLAINKHLESRGHVISSDPKEWKYFLNISGVKHYTNNDVKITALEDGLEYSLTKELLEEHKYTREVLMSNGSYYSELTSKYPLDSEYIMGCINPIDIDYAISAPDGTVLGYFNHLVEPQEINLIDNISKYLKKEIYRWKIDKFLEFENLYVQTLLPILYLNLPSVILNQRLRNINTPYVHSYFMDIYFKSNGLNEEVNYLNKKSRFWLYRNLDYIKHNIGKNDTLNKLIENVFNTNNIGISKIDLIKIIGFDENNLPYNKITLDPKPYNPYYNENDVITIDDVLTKEILDNKTVTDDLDDVDRIKNDNLEELKNMNNNSEDSKVVYIQMKNNYTFYPSKIDPIVCHWAHMLKYNILNVHRDFIDPNSTVTSVNGLRIGSIREYVDPITSISYKLNSYTAFLVLLKLLLNLTGKENLLLEKVNFNGILNKKYDVNNLEMYEDGLSRKIIDIVHNSIPEMPNSINREADFKEYMDLYFEFKTNLWIKMSNLQNPIITGNIKLYGNMVEIEDSLTISTVPKTIDEILLGFDIDYKLGNGYDLILSIKSLINAFTNFVDDKDFYQDEAEMFKTLLKKLTSYTIQPINQTSSDSSINLYDNEPTVVVTENPLFNVLEVDVDPLEDVELILDSYMDDYTNMIWMYLKRNPVKIYGMRDILGGGGLYYNVPIIRNVPINIVCVTNDVDYDILGEEWKDEFLSGIKISVDPLEDDIELDSRLEEHMDVTHISRVTNTVKMDTFKPMKGKGMLQENSTGVIKPKNIITVLDDGIFDILGEEWKDEFLSGIKISVDPLEEGAELDSRLEEYMDVTHISRVTNTVKMDMFKPMKGKGTSQENSTGVIKPKNIITVLDDGIFDALDEDWSSTQYLIKPSDVNINTAVYNRSKTIIKIDIDKIEL